MTPEQESHLETLLLAFRRHARRKYVQGAKEHGGNIWDNTTVALVNMAIDECVDQFVYLVTLRQKLIGLPAIFGVDPEDRPKRQGDT